MSIQHFHCPNCDLVILATASTCPSCGSERRAAAAPGQPEMFMLAGDHARLSELVRHEARSAPVRLLCSKLAQARICPQSGLPPKTVTMHSRVRFRHGRLAGVEERSLVYPGAHEPLGRTISILSPIGAALIGLRPGDTAETPDRLVVQDVFDDGTSELPPAG